MSSFQILRDSNYLNKVEPLAIQGSTCDAFVIALHGRKQFVKKLKPEFAIDPIYVSLFAKEYNVGKTLSHPNLVKYNNIETTKEGVLMFLDYISGETLADKLSSNPGFFLNEANLRRFTVQLLSCLSYLHSMQIVHLDIKPENLMLTQVDNSLKVLDLGFCYTDIYSPLVGKTDQFAAPEQYTDTTSDLSSKTDLYAVGRILEYIETRTGHSLPRKYLALKAFCLESNPEDRPASASECIALLGDGRPRKWLVPSLFMLLVVLLSFLTLTTII